MESVRDAWTDERLDDLSDRMGDGFGRVDTDVRELRSEMNLRFDRTDARLAAMQRTMVNFSGLMVVAMVGFTASVLTQV